MNCELNKRNAASGELERDGMIQQNMALVGYVAARFLGRGYEYEDIYQYGCIGLIKAVDRFDPAYGVAFSTYAVPLIIGEIKRFLRGDGAVHISRTIKENAVKVVRALDNAGKEGKRVSIDDICLRTGLDKHEAILAMSSLAPVKSLSEPVAGDNEILLQDIIGKDEGQQITDSIALRQAMEKLDESERELIVRRYYARHTQNAIACDMGMTQVQISRMEKRVLTKLRGLLI